MSKVLITRSREQSQPFAAALVEAGFEPVFFPTIAIRPVDDLSALDEAVANLETYAWVIFTSANAVDVFFSPPLAPPEGGRTSPFPFWGKARMGATPKIAAVGTKTAEALQAHGVDVDFIPEEFVGEALFAGFGDVAGKWFLLPRAKVAREILPQEIAKAGGIVHEIAVYETVTADLDPDGLAALQAGVNIVTFTSPSTVKNFVKLAQSAGIDPLHLPSNPLIACIGPVTEKAAREAGFSPIVMAETYTTDGLIEKLLKHKGHEESQSF